MPRRLTGGRVEAHERFGEQVRAGPPAAPVVPARRRRREVQQPTRLIERHRRPDIRMAGGLPGAVAPRVRTEVLGRLRNGEEHPGALAGPHVEGLNRARRIAAVLQPIRNAGADDHQVPVDDRRRGRLACEAAARRARGSSFSAGGAAAAGKVATGLPVFASTAKRRWRPAMKIRVSPFSPRQKATPRLFSPVPTQRRPLFVGARDRTPRAARPCRRSARRPDGTMCWHTARRRS